MDRRPDSGDRPIANQHDFETVPAYWAAKIFCVAFVHNALCSPVDIGAAAVPARQLEVPRSVRSR